MTMSKNQLGSAADIVEVYLNIRTRSLFSLLKQADVKKLVENGHAALVRAAPGTVIARRDRPSELFIVAGGKVELHRPGTRDRAVEEVETGRSIELAALLGDAERWDYEWVAATSCELLRLEAGPVLALLAADPVQFTYLKRITLDPALHRVKNDLRMFVTEPAKLRQLIVGLQCADLDTIGAFMQEDPAARHDMLLIVKTGEVVAYGFKDGQMRGKLRHLIPGGYGVVDLDPRHIRFDSSPTCELYYAPVSELVKLVGEGPFNAFSRACRIAAEEEAPTAPAAPAAAALAVVLPGENTVEEDPPQLEEYTATAKRRRLFRKKPLIIKQHDQMDCGAASLAMVAAHYGRNIGVPEFRRLVHVTREGASMLSVKKGATAAGLRALGVFCGWKSLKSYQLPAICLMQYHFVVLFEARDDVMIVGDPERGLRKVPVERFAADFSGNAMLLKPTPAFHEYPERTRTFGRYLALLREHTRVLRAIILLAICSFVLGLGAPFLSQLVFDEVLVKGRHELLHAFAAAIFGMAVCTALVEWTQAYLTTHLGTTFDAKFSGLFMRHVYRLPLSFFAVRRIGDFTSRLGDLGKIQGTLTTRPIGLAMSLLSIVVYGAVVYIYSPYILATIGVGAVVMMGFVLAVTPRQTALAMESFRAQSKNSSVFIEQVKYHETIKSLGAEVPARWRWEGSQNDLLALGNKMTKVQMVTSTAQGAINHGLTTAITIVSVYLHMKGELTLGQVAAVSGLAGRVVGPTLGLLGSYASFRDSSLSFSRIDDIVTVSPEQDRTANTAALPEVSGRVAFDKVSFRYGNEFSPLALKGIDLAIEPGETVALVGGSGSGKTTLAYLLSHLYVPTAGKVLVDGLDVADWPKTKLRQSIAMVMQESRLFSGSILENIALGDEKPNLERAVAAAKAADAHDFIMKLPKGYGTGLGAKLGLSGGQRQRLSIARALYKDPPILVLDEATSALDSVSEATIVKNMKKRASKRTTIIIAHRLNTVLYADRIVVLEKGVVVESGNHRELLARQGRYWALFKRQLAA